MQHRLIGLTLILATTFGCSGFMQAVEKAQKEQKEIDEGKTAVENAADDGAKAVDAIAEASRAKHAWPLAGVTVTYPGAWSLEEDAETESLNISGDGVYLTFTFWDGENFGSTIGTMAALRTEDEAPGTEWSSPMEGRRGEWVTHTTIGSGTMDGVPHRFEMTTIALTEASSIVSFFSVPESQWNATQVRITDTLTSVKPAP